MPADPATPSSRFAPRAPRWTRPALEVLEDRLAPSVSPLGPPFPVNTFTAGDQSAPAVAADAAGNSVVVWQSLGQDGSFYGVYGQRYDAQGNPLGGEFQVNTFTAGNQWQPEVAAAPGGGFVVTWQSDAQDGSRQGVYARRYDASGSPLGAEFRVNTFTAEDQVTPAVAVGPDGAFVIAWKSMGQGGFNGSIYAQRYDASGDPAGAEFLVATPVFEGQEQEFPGVAIDPAGNFVITSFQRGGGISALSFDPAGRPLGGLGLASTFADRGAASAVVSPSVAVAPDGTFVGAWRRSESGLFVFPETDRIEAQRFAVPDVRLGDVLSIDLAIDPMAPSVPPADLAAEAPALAADAAGNLLFAWGGRDGSDTGVFLRGLNAGGAPVSGKIRANPSTAGTQGSPSVTALADGGFLVVWEGLSADGSALDIFARRYLVTAAPGPIDATVGAVDRAGGVWYLRNSNGPGAPDVPPFAYGAPGWLPVAGDWDADGPGGVGAFDPFTGTWYLRNSASPGGPDVPPFAYGAAGWLPVVGDWFGTGADTVGVVDPNTFTWYLRDANSPGETTVPPFAYGAPGWVPVAGDWDGDGIDTIGVFDPFTATWYLRNANAASGQDRPGTPPDVPPFAYGLPGWVPVVGDWDGDGTDTVGLIDPFTGIWYLRNSNNAGGPDITPFAYGLPGWTPVAGDWDGAAQALLAAGRRTGDAPALSQADLDATVSVALARLGGADPGWAGARYEGAALGGSLLALAFPDSGRVLVDDEAAGHGWFVDPTPRQDEEFIGGVARPGTGAEGRVDLLTVLMHEMGHLAGRGHTSGGLMGEVLGPGTRALAALDAASGTAG